MKYTVKWFMLTLLSFTAIKSHADNTWYHGNIQTIVTYSKDGSFLFHLKNPDIQNKCLFQRVIFRVSEGVERSKVNSAYISKRKYL